MKVLFIQLGPKTPKYGWLNMARVSKMVGGDNIIFASDNTKDLGFASSMGYETFLYSRQTQKRQLPKTLHDKSFRRGFWIYSLERLIVIDAVHKSWSNEQLLHIEMDMLLLPNFPFEIFTKQRSIMWPQVSQDHDIASIIFSPNATESSWLAETVIDFVEANPNLTDMTVLAKIRLAEQERVRGIPVWNFNWPGAQREKFTSRNSKEFKGIFDAATLGMWITGRDPRNTFGWLKVQQPTPEHFVTPQDLSFELFDKNRLQVSHGACSTNLYSLHIHSKNLRIFRQPGIGRELRNFVTLTQGSLRFRRFYLYPFLETLIQVTPPLRVWPEIFRKLLRKLFEHYARK